MNEHKTPREHLKELPPKKKLLYLWNYYKLHFLLICVVLYAIGFIVYGKVTEKENVLYVAAINVSLSDETSDALTTQFINSYSENPAKSQVYLYDNLYLSDGEDSASQFVVASRMKILATIDAEELDVIITSGEVLAAFEEKEYLSASFEITDSKILADAGYSEPVYLGVIANSPRSEAVSAYIEYLK